MEEQLRDEYLIDQFLQNALTESERSEFEERKIDEAFVKKLEWMSDLVLANRSISKESLKSKFQQIETGLQPIEAKKTSRGPRILWYAAAASILILITTFVVLRNQSKPNPQELYAEYFEPFPNLADPIMKSDDQDADSMSAFQLFESGRYAEASEAFDEMVPKTGETYFFYALNELSQNKPEEALSLFALFNDQPDAEYYDAFEWYNALALLLGNRLDEAKTTLDKIEKEVEHPYLDQAARLRRSLDR